LRGSLLYSAMAARMRITEAILLLALHTAMVLGGKSAKYSWEELASDHSTNEDGPHARYASAAATLEDGSIVVTHGYYYKNGQHWMDDTWMFKNGSGWELLRMLPDSPRPSPR
jgi:hypothetical protein